MVYKDRKTILGLILTLIMLLMVYAIALLRFGDGVTISHNNTVTNSVPIEISGSSRESITSQSNSISQSATNITGQVISNTSEPPNIDKEDLVALQKEQFTVAKPEDIASNVNVETEAKLNQFDIETLDAELEKLEREKNKFDSVDNVLGLPSENSKNSLETDKDITHKSEPTGSELAIERLKNMSFEKLTFKFGELKLSDQAKAMVRQVSKILIAHNNINLSVNNYTDSYGDDEFNLNLSKQRAKVIYSEFLAEGVNISQMTYQGFGEANPIASNKNLAGRRKNRRTELKFSLVN